MRSENMAKVLWRLAKFRKLNYYNSKYYCLKLHSLKQLVRMTVATPRN